MKLEWHSNNFEYEKLILVGDIGGTNSNLGLMGYDGGSYSLIAEGWWSSGDIIEFSRSVSIFLDAVADYKEELRPDYACIAAAGPVSNNRCELTNCSWYIDGNEIYEHTGIETRVINDFLAISHGVTLLNVRDEKSVEVVSRCNDASPQSSTGVKLVIGPGTGLGVSYIVNHNGRYIPFPSEGGHSDFAAFDEESRKLKEFVQTKTGVKPGIEPVLSGPGIATIFDFLISVKNFREDEGYREVLAVPFEERAEIISRYSETSEVCSETMKLFARILGNVAGSLSAVFLPAGGIYIAGGIAAKNISSVTCSSGFMKTFETSYNAGMRNFIKNVPVYIVKNYDISLYGAARAAMEAIDEKKVFVSERN